MNHYIPAEESYLICIHELIKSSYLPLGGLGSPMGCLNSLVGRTADWVELVAKFVEPSLGSRAAETDIIAGKKLQESMEN